MGIRICDEAFPATKSSASYGPGDSREEQSQELQMAWNAMSFDYKAKNQDCMSCSEVLEMTLRQG